MTGLMLFVGTMLISLYATAKVKATYAKYSKMRSSSGYTGAEVAASILRAAGIHDVKIAEVEHTLADHYDPVKKMLVLSSENFHGTSPAALGVSAHECGHAIQHKARYAPLELRMSAVGFTQIAHYLVWLPVLGAFTGLIAPYTGVLIAAIGWGIIMLFNLVTLPVEFDASRRAKLILDNMGFVRTVEERSAVNKVLNAAALTYVAAFLTSLAYFLWHLLPLLMGRRN